MSHFNPNQHFDVENWREQKIAQRTKDALAARDAAFAEKHAETPLRELALYLVRCARTLRHSPAPCEVDGGAFIEQRFGSWDAALRAACLPPARMTAKLNSTARYRKERAIQEPLFLAERKEKKRQKQIEKNLRQGQLAHEKAVKRRAQRDGSRGRESRRRKRHHPLSSRDSLNGDCQLSIRVGGEKPPLPPPLLSHTHRLDTGGVNRPDSFITPMAFDIDKNTKRRRKRARRGGGARNDDL